MSDYGSKYEEVIRKIVSSTTLGKVTRVEGVGAFEKQRPYLEKAKQKEIENNTDEVDSQQIKSATVISETQAKIENTNLESYVNGIFTESSVTYIDINGVQINREIVTFNFVSPNLFLTFNTNQLGYILDNSMDIEVIGKFTN
jgi:hypothetical protein